MRFLSWTESGISSLDNDMISLLWAPATILMIVELGGGGTIQCGPSWTSLYAVGRPLQLAVWWPLQRWVGGGAVTSGTYTRVQLIFRFSTIVRMTFHILLFLFTNCLTV